MSRPCPTGKRVYSTQARANRAITIALSRGERPLAHYQCPDCGGWHLTTKRTGRRVVVNMCQGWPLGDYEYVVWVRDRARRIRDRRWERFSSEAFDRCPA